MSGPDAFLGSPQTTPGIGNYDAHVDNGLAARSYVPLGEIASAERDHVLKSLQRARIAAFVRVRPTGQVYLYVDALEYHDAHAVIVASGAQAPSAQSRRQMDADDTDARFAELTQGWEVDTVAAIRDTVEQFERDDEVNDMTDPTGYDESTPTRRRSDLPGQTDLQDGASAEADHYVAPNPPPIPQMRPTTLKAILLIVLGLVLLGFGGLIDSNSTTTAFLGSLGILTGAALLVMNMRPNRDEFDDGAVL